MPSRATFIEQMYDKLRSEDQMHPKYETDAQQALENNRELKARKVSQVMHFRALRTNGDGDEQDVAIKIAQTGPPGFRWQVEVSTDDGRTAYGNGADTIEEAIAIVHWNDLG